MPINLPFWLAINNPHEKSLLDFNVININCLFIQFSMYLPFLIFSLFLSYLSCPIPLIKTKTALDESGSGDTVKLSRSVNRFYSNYFLSLSYLEYILTNQKVLSIGLAHQQKKWLVTIRFSLLFFFGVRLISQRQNLFPPNQKLDRKKSPRWRQCR